ncbi:Cys-Gln thioester bond-forming surface protein [Enterococcus faecalis]|uniref:SpaA isopeptide-forming pilin-related protein n=1 Tax=Enterococcus faecalis TaxID=1351 RepID=UPI0013D489B8|nr:SpaA isopeptide-forming pilin-related protein [Enterococcus faecalis]EJM6035837.1 Cys-Gln thioester bond-forming surface protein [Enterococcus faecalis]NFA63716.1 LPXTG cell wall anchor domain-containing protein [Enterococcus faecalis]HAP3019625.1 Cys-Gln thioester bond-forming surface protein [Enterococcus faecalis]
MKTKLNITQKMMYFIMIIVTLCGTLFTNISPVHASSLNLDEKTDYSYTGYSSNVGKIVTHDIYVLKMDGKKVFCIESGIHANSGEGFVSEAYVHAKKELLSKIAYYGYTATGKTHYDYAVTQVMIWEALGDQYQSSTIPNYYQRKAEIMALVNKHDILPSFNGQSVSVTVGDSITLTDSNGVLKDMTLEANDTNTTATHNGNTLKITPTKNSNDGAITFRKVPQNEIGTSIVYKKPNEQSMVEFHLSNSKQATVRVDVLKLGNVQAKKVDENTGKALPNAKLKFEYNNTSKEMITDSNGLAAIKDIPEGTTVTITEVTAPNGYVNKGEIKKVVIKPNTTVSVTLNNQEQLGQVLLSKTGKEFGSTMFNKYYSLEGAVYDIYKENGAKVSSMTTDVYGKATSSLLKLGKYYALESKAPDGYLLNKNKIPFDLKYAGQTIEITSANIVQEEQEQKGNATLIKEDSKTGSVPQGGAKLDGAVYELHRTSDNRLMKEVTIKNGNATVQGLYLDDYYWIETKAPEGYLIDNEKHHFTLKYAGQTVETAVQSTTAQETVITGGFDLVKFGNYDWKGKLGNLLNKKEIKPLKDVEFSVYSDTSGKLVQKGLTDKEGYLKFTNLPYDVYTVKETKTPEGYKPVKDFKVTIREQNETHHYAVENKVIEEKLKVVKVDAETGKTIPRSDAGFQIKNMQTGKLVSMPKFNADGETDTFFTNDEGYLITLESLSYGDYELIEVQAPEGYVLSKEAVKFKVDGSNDGLIEICFKDQSQKGIAILSKTGQTPIDVTVKESEYGKVYKFVYDYKPVADVTYRIEAVEDIKTNDGTIRVEKGETVAMATTDENGKWQSPELYLGKYQAIEVSTPNGYILDDTPIPFELKYAGQLVELTSTSLTATNDFQSLDIQLFKNEEAVSSWENNKPKIEIIKGNNKVFGVFTREAQKLSDTIRVPENALIAYQTVKDGKAMFKLKLPQGKYYLKELDAGSSHVENDTEYDFEFTAENNNTTFPIHIYQDTVAYGSETLQRIAHNPILNKLHFNQFIMKKVNETANFDKENSVEFNYDTLGTGAVFRLESKDGKVLQEVTIDKDGLGIFKNIPVGTFYLKEKISSSSQYLVSKEVIRIESTKDGIKAFNEKGVLLGEQSNSSEISETIVLFELKNQLIKGTAELTKKDVSTGELLPNTGVRILDKDKNMIIEGRTNEKGIFTFKNLPKGIYYFQEFDAPEGYKLDKTPIQFEIKEHKKVVKCEMTNHKIETQTTPTQLLPKTGDAINIDFVLLGFAISGVALGVLYFLRKNSKIK